MQYCPVKDPLSNLNAWEKLETIKKTAETEPAAAAALCSTFSSQLQKDQCFANVAEGSKSDSYCTNVVDDRAKDECHITVSKAAADSSICDKVVGETRADRCYMYFATSGTDYTVCEKVKDYYLKQLCDSMKQLSEQPQVTPEIAAEVSGQ